MSQNAAEVLIRDDGELCDLRVLLDEIGVAYEDANRTGGQAQLLVTTPRYALGLAEGREQLPECQTHIVMADSLSNTIRAQLQRFRCDYVVEQNFHSAALQLLILHSLYRGPERRTRDRSAMAMECKLKIGWRTRQATLVQLSEQGCGLLVNGECESGSQVVVTLPKEMTGTGAMTLRGRTVGRDDTRDGKSKVSIVFSELDAQRRKGLRHVMIQNALGGHRMTPIEAKKQPAAKTKTPQQSGSAAPRPPAAPRPSAALPAPAAEARDRRNDLRAEYASRVLAAGYGEARAVIGRDLSVGGMLAEYSDGFDVGDRFKLILFGHEDEEPLIVQAEVLRISPEKGVALRFDEMKPKTKKRLQELVKSLPVLCGREESSGSRSVVVSEIVD